MSDRSFRSTIVVLLALLVGAVLIHPFLRHTYEAYRIGQEWFVLDAGTGALYRVPEREGASVDWVMLNPVSRTIEARSDTIRTRTQERAMDLATAPRWQPGPEVLAALAGRSAEAASLGRSVYARHCESCHGVRGAGDGVGGARLIPAPSDFTDTIWKQGGDVASLVATIRNGIPETGMKGYTGTLREDEIVAVAQQVMTFAIPPELVPPQGATSADPLPRSRRSP